MTGLEPATPRPQAFPFDHYTTLSYILGCYFLWSYCYVHLTSVSIASPDNTGTATSGKREVELHTEMLDELTGYYENLIYLDWEVLVYVSHAMV